MCSYPSLSLPNSLMYKILCYDSIIKRHTIFIILITIIIIIVYLWFLIYKYIYFKSHLLSYFIYLFAKESSKDTQPELIRISVDLSSILGTSNAATGTTTLPPRLPSSPFDNNNTRSPALGSSPVLSSIRPLASKSPLLRKSKPDASPGKGSVHMVMIRRMYDVMYRNLIYNFSPLPSSLSSPLFSPLPLHRWVHSLTIVLILKMKKRWTKACNQ